MGIELKINYPPNYPPRNSQKSSEIYTFDKFALQRSKLLIVLDIEAQLQPSTNAFSPIMKDLYGDLFIATTQIER